MVYEGSLVRLESKLGRDCVSIVSHDTGGAAVLVVSANEDRSRFNSEVFHLSNIEAMPSRIYEFDEWLTSMWVSPSGVYFLASALGTCIHDDGGAYVEHKVSDKRLFRIWGLHDRAVYAVGAHGTCARFDGFAWSTMNAGLTGHLYGIAGTREDNLICVGYGGFVARYDGSRWTPLELPTRAWFRAAYCVGADEFLLCGLDGECFRLRDGELHRIQSEAHDFHTITSYRGEIYFGSPTAGVFVLRGEELVLVKDKAKAYAMSASDTSLWTCGLDRTTRFDGEVWRRVDFA